MPSLLAAMSLAASETAAGCIRANEMLTEPGDVLSVVAPAAPDAPLADIGFTIPGTQVL